MSFIALEISLNDEKVYTVGIEEWRHLNAGVRAIRWPAELVEKHNQATDEIFPEHELENIHLEAHVSIPIESDSADGRGSQTGSFDVKNLAVGDVVTIKVIESDTGDEPAWRNAADGRIAVARKN